MNSYANTLKALPLIIMLLLASKVSAAPFYAENFNFDGQTADAKLRFDAFTQTGWKAFRGNSKIGSFGSLKVAIGKSQQLPAFNSFPKGPDDGYALWTKGVDALTIFTEEYPFNLRDLETVDYLQKLDGSALDSLGQEVLDGTRLILKLKLVDGSIQWYISDQAANQIKKNAFEAVRFYPKTMTYSIPRYKEGLGPKVPDYSGFQLPAAGIVIGFGVFIDKTDAKVRIDNYTLSDGLISNGLSPQAVPTHVPGSVPTTTTGDPEDTDDGGQGAIEGTPTATATATAVSGSGVVSAYTYCAANSALTRKVVAGKAVRKALLTYLSGKSTIALRNRAIVDFLLSTGTRISSLENIRVSDLYTHDGRNYLNVYGQEVKPVRISKGLAKNIENYLKKAGIQSESSSPLFRFVSKVGEVSKVALCFKDINQLIKTTANKAGFKKEIKYLP